MDGIESSAMLAAIVTCYVVIILLAWLLGITFRGLRINASPGWVISAVVMVITGAGVLAMAALGTVELIDRHDFFAEIKGGQWLLIIGWAVWGTTVIGAFYSGEKGLRITDRR